MSGVARLRAFLQQLWVACLISQAPTRSKR